MLRFVARFGIVRLVGRRAVPALLVWDLAMLANRARRIPLVDRTLRRGAGAARRGVGVCMRGVSHGGVGEPAPGTEIFEEPRRRVMRVTYADAAEG